ncbi:MAG: hypothetical protein KJ808_03430 [Acidobacteria bacterium]|nr:hypothetical protein [Acidobacteriota bacterium]MBU4306354.1 hypothetical protein [Acidobacteriota bacterium]MBU4405539.1 hypothetical protein [Acidobacteriota bacterium]MCG2810751.1 hypothetical protein [Candidatus Aminicenantes bacterium]
MNISAAGKIVHHEWLRTSMVRPGIELDAFVIMPNHLHGIISIRLRRGVPLERPVDVGDEDRATRPPAFRLADRPYLKTKHHWGDPWSIQIQFNERNTGVSISGILLAA